MCLSVKGRVWLEIFHLMNRNYAQGWKREFSAICGGCNTKILCTQSAHSNNTKICQVILYSIYLCAMSMYMYILVYMHICIVYITSMLYMRLSYKDGFIICLIYVCIYLTCESRREGNFKRTPLLYKVIKILFLFYFIIL